VAGKWKTWRKGGSKKAEEESKSGHPRRGMSHLYRIKTAQVGHPNLLGELKLRHPSAMEAGIAEHVWLLEEVVCLLDRSDSIAA
jgi:hypothetical protein